MICTGQFRVPLGFCATLPPCSERLSYFRQDVDFLPYIWVSLGFNLLLRCVSGVWMWGRLGEAENREACHSSAGLHGVGWRWDASRAQTEFLADDVEESVVHTQNMWTISCSLRQNVPSLLLKWLGAVIGCVCKTEQGSQLQCQKTLRATLKSEHKIFHKYKF